MTVVIVGNGMAGARLMLEIRRRDPNRRIVVFDPEPGPAYNRILLSDVLAGKVREDDLRLAEPDGPIDRRDGVAVKGIDRATRTIIGDDGSRTRYDSLVLATGSRPILPPVPGLAENALAFRTVHDCRAIIAAAEGSEQRGRARRAVVLGGGLLGLEAARGLARRGLGVTVVHLGRYPMDRQLDPEAGEMLQHTLADLGVRVLVEATATEVSEHGVTLSDGTVLPADLVVAACGVRPDTTLAGDAGLAVDDGIVVDDRMRTSDPDILAIGDCVQHRGRVYGLVAPAWEQASVAARVITGEGGSYRGSKVVTRLKAPGIDLASMGEPSDLDELAEVVTFVDPARRCYQKVVIRDGRLIGAILLGDNPSVGTVTQLYDRDDQVPMDPRSLLFGKPSAVQVSTVPSDGSGSAADTMCRCNGVTVGAITKAWIEGARTVQDVSQATHAGTGCGGCRDTIAGFVEHLKGAVA